MASDSGGVGSTEIGLLSYVLRRSRPVGNPNFELLRKLVTRSAIESERRVNFFSLKPLIE